VFSSGSLGLGEMTSCFQANQIKPFCLNCSPRIHVFHRSLAPPQDCQIPNIIQNEKLDIHSHSLVDTTAKNM
jgi:hypothetical protein